MTIDAARERLFRVVQMKRADILDAGMLVELLHRLLVHIACANVITRREDVTRVDAHTKA